MTSGIKKSCLKFLWAAFKSYSIDTSESSSEDRTVIFEGSFSLLP